VLAQVISRAGAHGQDALTFLPYFGVENQATLNYNDIAMVGFTVVGAPGESEREHT
jgi:hypothetical protein